MTENRLAGASIGYGSPDTVSETGLLARCDRNGDLHLRWQHALRRDAPGNELPDIDNACTRRVSW